MVPNDMVSLKSWPWVRIAAIQRSNRRCHKEPQVDKGNQLHLQAAQNTWDPGADWSEALPGRIRRAGTAPTKGR